MEYKGVGCLRRRMGGGGGGTDAFGAQSFSTKSEKSKTKQIMARPNCPAIFWL